MTRTAAKKPNAIEKALEIMLNFQDGKSVWGIRELAAELNFSPATVQRILKTLKTYGFVRQDPKSKQYYLGNIFYRFLTTLNHSETLTSAGQRHMEAVFRDTQETIHLNIVEDGARLCIQAIESPKVLKADMTVGSRSPLHIGASAKCLLAFSSRQFQDDYFDTQIISLQDPLERRKLMDELHRIHRQGYAVSLGEYIPGRGCISAPVFNYKGEILASMSLAIPEIRISRRAYLNHCVRVLTREARAFSRDMGLRHSELL